MGEPTPRSTSVFHRAATFSVWALVGSFLLSQVPFFRGNSGGFIGLGIISALICLSGVAAGVVALFGLSRYGAKGILFKALCGILVPLAVGLLVSLALLNARSRAEAVDLVSPVIERQMELILLEGKKSEGTMIDESTRLDQVELLPGNKLVYTYSVVDIDKSDLAPDSMEKTVRPVLLQSLGADPTLRVIRMRGVTFVYRYKDRAGNLIGEITISPEDR